MLSIPNQPNSFFGQASLSGACHDTVLGISSVTNKQTFAALWLTFSALLADFCSALADFCSTLTSFSSALTGFCSTPCWLLQYSGWLLQHSSLLETLLLGFRLAPGCWQQGCNWIASDIFNQSCQIGSWFYPFFNCSCSFWISYCFYFWSEISTYHQFSL